MIKRIITLAMAMGATPAWAATAAVFPFRPTNVTDGDAQTATLLFRAEYERASGHAVVPLDAAANALGHASDPATACRALGCQVYVTGELSRLGTRVFVNAEEHDASGKTLWAEHATAATPEDLETVLPRVALALVRKQVYAETRTHETVTLREAETPVRLRPDKIVGFRVGLYQPFIGGDNSVPSVEAAFDMRFERGSYFLGWAAGLAIPSASGQGSTASMGGPFLEIHGAYYLTDGEIAPYIGGGLQPRITIIDRASTDPFAGGDDAGVGLGALGRLGVMFMRSSGMRLYAEFTADQETIQVAGVHPTLLHFDAGMGF